MFITVWVIEVYEALGISIMFLVLFKFYARSGFVNSVSLQLGSN